MKDCAKEGYDTKNEKKQTDELETTPPALSSCRRVLDC